MNSIQKIMHLTDLHLNPLHRIPQSRTSAFHRHISDKWNFVCEEIEREKIELGIISGDTFHLKNPKIYCPEDIIYYSKFFEKTSIPWVAIPGNHDLPEASFDQLEKSPYNLLVKATENLKTLAVPCKVEDRIITFLDSFQLNGGGVPINVYGYPYFPLDKTMDDLSQVNERIDRGAGFNILLLHMDILLDPNVFLFWSVAGYDTVLDRLPNVDLVCLGHIHMSFPVYKRINPVSGSIQMVSKPWSFSRIAKDYFNKTEVYEKLHRPSYGLITIEQGPGIFNAGIEYREIPIVPFERAFKKDILKKQLENSMVIKDFMEEVKKNFASVDDAFKVIDPEEYLEGVSMSVEVRECLNKYLVDCD